MADWLDGNQDMGADAESDSHEEMGMTFTTAVLPSSISLYANIRAIGDASDTQSSPPSEHQADPQPSQTASDLPPTERSTGMGQGDAQDEEDPDWDSLTEEEKTLRRDSGYKTRQGSLAYPPGGSGR